MITLKAFWDITDYIEDYPNLSAFPEDVWINSSIDGRNYGVPRVRNIDGNGFLNIRRDWLDNLGLDVPQTLDELYEVLYAFTHDDPNQSGEDNTVGFLFNGGYSIDIERMFNGSYRWKEENEELIDTTLEPEMREALLWQKEAFDDGMSWIHLFLQLPKRVEKFILKIIV